MPNDPPTMTASAPRPAPAREHARALPRPEPPWHAMAPHEALRALGSDEAGLDDAEARARLALHGANALPASKPVSAWRILLEQLRSVVVLLLVAALAVAVLTGDPAEGAAIGAVLVINLALGFATEYRAHRAMEALLALEVPHASVVRGGTVREVDARELVPGDVVVVEAGQGIPADARLLRATELLTVEAALTGESLPVPKHAAPAAPRDAPLPERSTMIYQGTAVAAGSGRAAVTATGAATEVGRIGVLVGSIETERTPLERRLDTLGKRLALVSLAAGAVVALLDVLGGASLGTVLETGIAVAVAAVPEGLPAVVTIAMAVGMRRMARRRALIRRLPVVESLGSVTVVCTDKTGTLTTAEQMAEAIWVPGREIRVTGAGYDPAGEFLADGAAIAPPGDALLTEALAIGVLANRADVSWIEDRWQPRGDPTEAALVVAARKAGMERGQLLARWPEIAELPFSSERMLMATFHRRAAHEPLVAFVKGAPSRVLERATRLRGDGGDRPLDDAARAEVLARNHDMAARGLRVLALATGTVPEAADGALRDLTLVGLVGLIDAPAPGVRETIQRLHDAGVRTVMITGDQALTAEAIARDLGVLQPGDTTLDGRTIDALDDAALRARVPHTAAFSRVSPEAKLRIVRAHQARGEIVAMLGDGVNDAAALRQADVGVVMGRRGTDVAKDVAGVVLEDDRFQTIAVAVEEGRIIYANIRRFVLYLFSCNLGEILLLLGAGLAGAPLPLTPLQILWLNLVTDSFPALALAFEPAEPGVMRRPPRPPRSALFGRELLVPTLGYGALIAGVSLAAFAWGRATARGLAPAMTMAFMTVALSQIFHLGNARSHEHVLSRRRALANPYAVGALVLTLGLQLLAAAVDPLARVLGVAPLAAREWMVVLALSLAPAALGQLTRVLREWRARRDEASR